jgi:hypothetical protein
MPFLKSPAKILKLWKKGTTDYAKATEEKKLKPNEEDVNKRVVVGLERLRKLAPKTPPDPDEFAFSKDNALEFMNKFRKLFKPKKDKAPAKKFYQGVCRLILSVENLAIGELDPSEDEPSELELNDINADELDSRDGAAEASPAATPGSQPAATPAQAAPPMDEEKWKVRFTAVQKELLLALKENRGDSSKLRAFFAFCQEKGTNKEYAAGHQGLDRLEKLLAEAKAAAPKSPASANGAATKPIAKVPYAQLRLAWEMARNKVAGELRTLEQAILAEFKSDPAELAEAKADVRQLDQIMATFSLGLRKAFDQGAAAATDEQRLGVHAAAGNIIKRYQTYLDGDAFAKAIAANPFAPVSLKAMSAILVKMQQQLTN